MISFARGFSAIGQNSKNFWPPIGCLSPDVWQCEVTYINQFTRGREWHDFKGLSELYPIWSDSQSSPLLSRPQMATFAVAYAMPDDIGVLQFVSQPGTRGSDGAEIIQLSVSAIGRSRALLILFARFANRSVLLFLLHTWYCLTTKIRRKVALSPRSGPNQSTCAGPRRLPGSQSGRAGMGAVQTMAQYPLRCLKPSVYAPSFVPHLSRARPVEIAATRTKHGENKVRKFGG